MAPRTRSCKRVARAQSITVENMPVCDEAGSSCWDREAQTVLLQVLQLRVRHPHCAGAAAHAVFATGTAIYTAILPGRSL